jgi:hypothetical protein
VRLFAITTVLLVCSLFNFPAIANAQTDKNVGICITYLILINKSNAADLASQQADNQNRAMQYARTELNEVKRLSANGKWTAAYQQTYAIKGDATCRKIGIRPGDYQN